MACTNFCNTSCPSPIPVTIIQNVGAEGATYAVPKVTLVPGSIPGITGVLNVQVEEATGGSLAGRFTVSMWFEDSADFTGIPTYVPPTVPGSQQFEVITDASGAATVALQYSGAIKTWYVYAQIGGNVYATPVAVQLGASA